MKNKQENMHPSMINAKIDENPDIREDSIKNNAFLNNPFKEYSPNNMNQFFLKMV